MNLRLIRLRSQLLVGPPGDSPQSVVGRLLAVQAQDDRGFRLAIRSRSRGLLAADVDESLNERRLVVTWLNRGTLHLIRSDDFWWLHPLTASRMASGIDRRLQQLGVSSSQTERGVDTIIGSIEAEGPLARQELGVRLDDEGLPTKGQALVFLLATASLRGLIVRGPVVDGNHAFVSVGDWLGAPTAPVSRQEALGRLALRYLEGHEPASPHDLAKWAGITLGDARLGFDQVADKVRPIEGGFIRRSSDLNNSGFQFARLLGAFDPILHGWASRDMWVRGHQTVITTNGIFRPVCVVEGRVVATWRLTSSGAEIDLLENVDEVVIATLVEDARDVFRFLSRVDPPLVVTVNPVTL